MGSRPRSRVLSGDFTPVAGTSGMEYDMYGVDERRDRAMAALGGYRNGLGSAASQYHTAGGRCEQPLCGCNPSRAAAYQRQIGLIYEADRRDEIESVRMNDRWRASRAARLGAA